MLLARLNELRRRGRETPYAAPSATELASYESWLREAARRAAANEEPPSSAPDGFALERQEDARGELWILGELPTRRRGAGAVVLRRGPARALVIEAPHTFFDVGTLPIGVAAFAELDARAFVINTVHRYVARLLADGGDDGEGRGGQEDDASSPSDVAHAPVSFFLKAHEVLGDGTFVVQLHGFAEDKAGAGAHVILSASGTNARLDDVATALGRVVDRKLVRKYPDDMNELGGMTNVEARLSRERRWPFLHVEIARAVRDELVRDAGKRSAFVRALSVVAPAERAP